MSSEVVLGIDLGTSFSTAAAFVNGKMRYALDGRGEPCVPSIVHFPKKGYPLVGADAQRLRATDPENTVAGVKRLLGCAPDSPELRIAQANSPFQIATERNGIKIVTQTGDHTPTEVASMIFGYLKRRAEVLFGKNVHKAVLTLPVKANDTTRTSTLKAAKMVGLDVIGTVEEPCAAALCHGLDDFKGERVFMVYDFGGGTFDVSIIRQTDNNLRVLRADGDEMLGGDDLDMALAKRIASYVWEQKQVDVTKDVVRWDRIQVACEQAKRALSSLEHARLRVADAIPGTRGAELDLVVKRPDAESCWSGLVQRSMRTAVEAMVATQVRPDALAGIVLAGGTTFVPLVQKQVVKVLQRPFIKSEDPQTAVATGAALLGAKAISVAY